jgi:hypothetical protein
MPLRGTPPSNLRRSAKPASGWHDRSARLSVTVRAGGASPYFSCVCMNDSARSDAFLASARLIEIEDKSGARINDKFRRPLSVMAGLGEAALLLMCAAEDYLQA